MRYLSRRLQRLCLDWMGSNDTNKVDGWLCFTPFSVFGWENWNRVLHNEDVSGAFGTCVATFVTSTEKAVLEMKKEQKGMSVIEKGIDMMSLTREL